MNGRNINCCGRIEMKEIQVARLTSFTALTEALLAAGKGASVHTPLVTRPSFYQFYRTLPLPENSSTRPKIRRESLTR
jgi:hypothetical protein